MAESICPVVTDVDRAVRTLAAGGLVAMPTETVYGLAADATNPDAVDRIFEVKGRPRRHPLILHVGDIDDVDTWADGLSEAARTLAATCWPGPLTLIVRRSAGVIDEVTGGRDTVGIRVPAHPMAQELLHRFGRPVAAPSANRFGRVSPTAARHVQADLAGILDPTRDVILDGGPSEVGIESTIVDTTVEPPELLRPGGIPAEDIARLLDGHVVASTDRVSDVGSARASGLLPSHYAPHAEVRLARSRPDAQAIARLVRDDGRTARVIDPSADPVLAARHLYDDLRQADADAIDVIVAVLPAAAGLGHALRDRLSKAAYPVRPDR